MGMEIWVLVLSKQRCIFLYVGDILWSVTAICIMVTSDLWIHTFGNMHIKMLSFVPLTTFLRSSFSRNISWVWLLFVYSIMKLNNDKNYNDSVEHIVTSRVASEGPHKSPLVNSIAIIIKKLKLHIKSNVNMHSPLIFVRLDIITKQLLPCHLCISFL